MTNRHEQLLCQLSYVINLFDHLILGCFNCWLCVLSMGCKLGMPQQQLKFVPMMQTQIAL